MNWVNPIKASSPYKCPPKPKSALKQALVNISVAITLGLAIIGAVVAHEERYALNKDIVGLEQDVDTLDQRQREYNKTISKIEYHIMDIKKDLKQLQQN